MAATPPLPADAAPWKVLLVDDESSVHEVSRLILAGLRFEGREVQLLSAHSAAQARALLAQQAGVALALIDVVMETDDAGIALVPYIREQLHDHDMQIVLRTGQPGMAPEAEIVRGYEVNGYVLKTEITAQRLHTIVIAGLRSYRHAQSLRGEAAAVAPLPDAEQQALRLELEAAREDDVVLLQAQPEIALASNQITGVELVPCWKTSRGLLPAARVAEVVPDGPARRRMARWLLAQACFWAGAWQAGATAPLKVSIPLVGDSLADCDTLQATLEAARQAGLAGTLDLLVSEQVLLSGHPDVRAAVDAVRAAGVTVTLVDFGGQTILLQRLNQLVPDRLKLHRLSVRGVVHDPERMALARSLIALAQTLNIVAIADGISSDADAQFFKWEDCEGGQGDALAPACAPHDLAAFLQHGRHTAH
ncbi:EAL domain-containing response regulator [Pseudorhodoferax sp.]|uniref:EAL domain-containing response regulator n=1 Tax=Pseudorhodoferax sp. TaxID=1993553 RepID=UPI002DD6558A|nr:EAL domain-containing protein [Pseudorhodoferax sp.]